MSISRIDGSKTQSYQSYDGLFELKDAKAQVRSFHALTETTGDLLTEKLRAGFAAGKLMTVFWCP